jgi:Ca2+-binding EF-hand superfamily protein
MTGRIPKRIDSSKLTELSSETIRLSSEHFQLDEQNRLVIDREDLAKIIQSQPLVGDKLDLRATEVEVSVKVKF